MLNPNEIANHKFDKAMGRGYRMEEVENYLGQVAGEMNELLLDKQELEKKMMVLAEKLEEYKRDEESLRAALLGAQKLGDSVVRDAKAKAASIIEDANAQANLLRENAKRAIEREQHAFIRMQREVATFRSKLQMLYKQHLELISSIPVDDDLINAEFSPKPAAEPAQAPAPAPEPVRNPVPPAYEEPEAPEDEPLPEEELVEDALQYSEQGLEYSEEEPYYEPEPELEPEPIPEPPKPRRESRFGPLKFGKDFDIKRDDEKRRR